MLILSQTTDKIQVVLAATVTTNQLQCVSSWRDVTSTPTYTPGRTLVNTNNTTDVDLVGSPAASTQRIIDFLSVYNADTASATVTIKLDASGTEYILCKEVLPAGATLRFVEGAGFSVSESYRPIKYFTVHANAGAGWTLTDATNAERFAENASRHAFMADLAGYTQVRLRSNQQVTSASANTPLFRAKYYTSFTTTFSNFLQLGASAQVEFSLTGTGYRDTGWVDMAAGAQIDGCCIGFAELGGDGSADPTLGATDIMFR